MNYQGMSPMNIGAAIEVVSGAVNYTFQYTYDDPNNLQAGLTTPLPFNQAALTAQSTTLDSTISTPIVAVRVLINSGTGTLRMRVLQAGIG